MDMSGCVVSLRVEETERYVLPILVHLHLLKLSRLSLSVKALRQLQSMALPRPAKIVYQAVCFLPSPFPSLTLSGEVGQSSQQLADSCLPRLHSRQSGVGVHQSSAEQSGVVQKSSTM